MLEDWSRTGPGLHVCYASRRQSSRAITVVIDALRYRRRGGRLPSGARLFSDAPSDRSARRLGSRFAVLQGVGDGARVEAPGLG